VPVVDDLTSDRLLRQSARARAYAVHRPLGHVHVGVLHLSGLQRAHTDRPDVTVPAAPDAAALPLAASASAGELLRTGDVGDGISAVGRDVVLVAPRSSQAGYVSRALRTVSYRQRSPRPVSTTDLQVPSAEP
jgi:hypothetical protein